MSEQNTPLHEPDEVDADLHAAVVIDERPAETQWSIVARQFRKNRAAVWGLRGAVVLMLLAIYAPVIASGLPLVWQAPGGEVEFPWFSKMFDVIYWENGVDRFFNLMMIAVPLGFLIQFGFKVFADERTWRRARTGVIAVTAVVAILQMLGWSALLTSNPYVDYRALEKQYEAQGVEFTSVRTQIPYGHREQLPEPEDQFLGIMNFDRGEVHLLGTDEIGRDIFTRLIYGTRISLTVGLVAVAIYVTIGTILGALAGFVGGWTDIAIMRAVEIVICIPGLFLILTIIALFGSRSIFMIMFAIGIVGWTGIARLVRGEFIRERGKEYVAAAKSLGISSGRTLFRHVLPNAVGPVIVAATFGVASAIIVESTLSFLGLGDVSVPSWGQILDDGRKTMYWHLIIPPGVAIFITVTLLNLVGDGLRDALDPKLRA